MRRYTSRAVELAPAAVQLRRQGLTYRAIAEALGCQPEMARQAVAEAEWGGGSSPCPHCGGTGRVPGNGAHA